MDKVVHFEIPVDDRARAKQFYSSIFGWMLNDVDMGGGMIYTGVVTTPVDDNMMPTEPGGINGGMAQRSDDLRSPTITVNVSSIDEYAKRIESAGGKVLTPRTEIPQMGAYAYFADTEGNVIGLWEDLARTG
jgi:predicted enzyme related to lactoylglutathione lyase